MSDENPTTITGDLIEDYIKRTNKVLGENHLAPEVKQILENDVLMFTFIKRDHKRTNTLFKYHLEQLNQDMKTNQAVNKFNAATWQIIQNIIQWGIIAFLTYRFLNKP